MANLIGQVTIPSGGKVQLSTALSQPSNANAGATLAALPVGNIYVQQLIVQNNGTHNARLGDVTVSSTKGLLLFPTASANLGGFVAYGTYLSDWWVFGTATDVIDFLFIQ